MGLIERIRKRFEEPLHKRTDIGSTPKPAADSKARPAPATKPRSRTRPKAEPRRKRPAARRRETPATVRQAGARARKAAGTGASVALEVAKIVREMLVIPAQGWMAVAEYAGRITLAAWRRVWPVLLAAWRLLRRLLAIAERELTPARMTILVAVAAIAALVASQWLDYRGVSVGTGDYAGVETVAPPPQLEGTRDRAGDAHSWVMLPLAAAALALVVLAATGRWRLGRLLVLVGGAVIAISLLVDAPKGLDEGTAAIAYQGAEADLLEGFWVQIVAGGVLVACGVLVPLNLRRRTAKRGRQRDAPRGAERRPRTDSGPRAARA